MMLLQPASHSVDAHAREDCGMDNPEQQQRLSEEALICASSTHHIGKADAMDAWLQQQYQGLISKSQDTTRDQQYRPQHSCPKLFTAADAGGLKPHELKLLCSQLHFNWQNESAKLEVMTEKYARLLQDYRELEVQLEHATKACRHSCDSTHTTAWAPAEVGRRSVASVQADNVPDQHERVEAMERRWQGLQRVVEKLVEVSSVRLQLQAEVAAAADVQEPTSELTLREPSLETTSSSNAWEYSALIHQLRQHVGGQTTPSPEPVLQMSPLPAPRPRKPPTKSPFELHVGAAVAAQPALQLHPSTLLETPLVEVASVPLTASEETAAAAAYTQLSAADAETQTDRTPVQPISAVDTVLASQAAAAAAAATAAMAGLQSTTASNQLSPRAAAAAAAAPDWHALGLLHVATSIYGCADSTRELPANPAAAGSDLGLQDWLNLDLIDLHSAENAPGAGVVTAAAQPSLAVTAAQPGQTDSFEWLDCAVGMEAAVTEWLNGSLNGTQQPEQAVTLRQSQAASDDELAPVAANLMQRLSEANSRIKAQQSEVASLQAQNALLRQQVELQQAQLEEGGCQPGSDIWWAAGADGGELESDTGVSKVLTC